MWASDRDAAGSIECSFEEMGGVRVVVESLDGNETGRLVERDRLDERLVGIEPNPVDTQRPGLVHEMAEQRARSQAFEEARQSDEQSFGLKMTEAIEKVKESGEKSLELQSELAEARKLMGSEREEKEQFRSEV